MYGYRLPGACGAFVLQTAFVLWAGRPLFFSQQAGFVAASCQLVFLTFFINL